MYLSIVSFVCIWIYVGIYSQYGLPREQKSRTRQWTRPESRTLPKEGVVQPSKIILWDLHLSQTGTGDPPPSKDFVTSWAHNPADDLGTGERLWLGPLQAFLLAFEAILSPKGPIQIIQYGFHRQGMSKPSFQTLPHRSWHGLAIGQKQPNPFQAWELPPSKDSCIQLRCFGRGQELILILNNPTLQKKRKTQRSAQNITEPRSSRSWSCQIGQKTCKHLKLYVKSSNAALHCRTAPPAWGQWFSSRLGWDESLWCPSLSKDNSHHTSSQWGATCADEFTTVPTELRNNRIQSACRPTGTTMYNAHSKGETYDSTHLCDSKILKELSTSTA